MQTEGPWSQDCGPSYVRRALDFSVIFREGSMP